MASDFNYDDDVEIGVTDGDWENPGPGIDVDFTGGTDGVDSIADSGSEPSGWHVSYQGHDLRITVNRDGISVFSSEAVTIPIYRIESSSTRMIRLCRGLNTTMLDKGIYIIFGKKIRFH